MKKIKLLTLPLLILLFVSSCSSVRVSSDYDNQTNFRGYRTYAYYKTGIDKAQISDLDKKRILRAIDTEMASRGFTKSQNPDVLISIFTKEREQVDVYNNNFGYGGFGFNRFGGGFGYGGSNVSTRIEGSLFIDLIDARNKQLVWQGRGIGTLNDTDNIAKKEQRIQKFVSKILQAYPPSIATR